VDTTASATRGKGANCAEVMAGDGGTSTFGSKDVNPIIFRYLDYQNSFLLLYY
jgi:hypothetical protein